MFEYLFCLCVMFTVCKVTVEVLLSANYIQQERRVFWYPNPPGKYSLGGGLRRYPGFWQSVRPVTGWKPMLNLDRMTLLVNLIIHACHFASICFRSKCCFCRR